ncbi:ATP-dependent DNA ligase [[Kitasatospora] papulosa]
MVLHPPVKPMLAQAREAIPLAGAMPGGMLVDPKFDGFRCLLFTPVEDGQSVILQTRRGAMYQARFPDLVAAAGQLPRGLVLDGELAVLEEGELSFTALQRRATAVRQAKVLAAELPAHFITGVRAGSQAASARNSLHVGRSGTCVRRVPDSLEFP